MAVVYLTVENVIEIHRQTMESMGQPAYPLRSEGDLDGAIHRCQWAARFEGIDIVEQGVRLAVAISQNRRSWRATSAPASRRCASSCASTATA